MNDKIYILDTSALLTFIEDEEGAESVESLLSNHFLQTHSPQAALSAP